MAEIATSYFRNLTPTRKSLSVSSLASNYQLPMLKMGHSPASFSCISVLFKQFIQNRNLSAGCSNHTLPTLEKWILRVEGERGDHLTITLRSFQCLLPQKQTDFPGSMESCIVISIHNFLVLNTIRNRQLLIS